MHHPKTHVCSLIVCCWASARQVGSLVVRLQRKMKVVLKTLVWQKHSDKVLTLTNAPVNVK